MSNIIDEPEVLKMVLQKFKKESTVHDNSLNLREINDVLFNANMLEAFRLYLIKRRIVDKIDLEP